MCHHLGVKLGVCHLLAELAGHHARELFKAAHALELDELVVIVGEGEAVLFELFFELFRLFLVDALLGALDERQHVAHAEDALRHAVGVEGLDHVELFARAHKLDGLAGRRADREGCAAAGVAVELREHDAVDAECLIKGGGGVHGVLTGHRVDDEQDLGRLDGGLDALELVHQRFVDVQAACGIEEDHVVAVVTGVLDGLLRDLNGVDLTHFENGNIQLLADDL